MNNIEPAIEAFVKVLDKLNISYAIGGSVASSVYGQVRFTQDADISVVAFANRIDKFCDFLQSKFYVSKEAVLQAHQNSSSFNLIHLDSVFKIDAFLVSDDPFKKQIIMRRKKIALIEDSDKRYALVSPEDVILLKLQWYIEGGSVSERQWHDVLGVLNNQQDQLDMGYMQNWAKELSVLDLLDKAIQQTKE